MRSTRSSPRLRELRSATSPARTRPARSPKSAPTAAKPAKGRTHDNPHDIGHPWWLADPIEGAARDRFDGQARYAGYMLGYALLALLALRYSPPAWTTTATDVAGSAVLPTLWLAAFRGAGALLVLVVSFCLVLGPAKSQSETTLDGGEVFLRISGAWSLGGLTHSGWILIGLYLAVSSGVTLAVWANPDEASHKVPSALACAVNSLLGVAFGFSLLITIVVTFVLVPLDHAKGHSVAGYFGAADLLLHNANVALMALEVLVNSLSIDFGDVSFVVLFGCCYLVWHQFIRYRYTRTLLYFFLNWQGPHPFKVASALVAALCFFFVCGGIVTEFVRPTPWGAPVVLLATRGIMRFRPPPGATVESAVAPKPTKKG